MNPRPSRILAAAVTLVTVGAMAVAVVAGAAVSGTPAPAAGLSASSPSAAATVVAGESRVAWPEGVGISTDATDEERLAAKLSFDMVAVPDDRADSVRSIPGLVIGGDASAGGTTYLAVPADDVPRVTAAVPDAAVTANARIDAATHQSPVPSWGEDAVDSPSASSDGAYDYDTTGAGTTVYVVDTGVQSDHPDSADASMRRTDTTRSATIGAPRTASGTGPTWQALWPARRTGSRKMLESFRCVCWAAKEVRSSTFSTD